MPASPTVPEPVEAGSRRVISARSAIGSLISSHLKVMGDVLVAQVEALFEAHPHEDAIAVVDGDDLGLVSRPRFFLILGRRFGFALYERRPVRLLMEQGLTVDAQVDSLEVVGLALRREPGRILDDVIVTRAGRFEGLVSMRSLTAHHKDLLAHAFTEVGVLEEENRRLAELREMESHLVAHLTHELRNPLTVIMGVADLLLADPALPARHQHKAQILMARASDLHAVINQMLDMAKLEAGYMVPKCEDVDPTPVLEELVAGARLHAGPKAILVEARLESLPPGFRTDPVFLRQIVANLLSNAVKFTESGSVTLRARFDGGLVVQVMDTGPGIRPEDVHRLFTRFVQLETTMRKRGAGTGLGLAIVKGLAEQLGGTVAVESSLGAGSTFSVWLPSPPDPGR